MKTRDDMLHANYIVTIFFGTVLSVVTFRFLLHLDSESLTPGPHRQEWQRPFAAWRCKAVHSRSWSAETTLAEGKQVD